MNSKKCNISCYIFLPFPAIPHHFLLHYSPIEEVRNHPLIKSKVSPKIDKANEKNATKLKIIMEVKNHVDLPSDCRIPSKSEEEEYLRFLLMLSAGT